MTGTISSVQNCGTIVIVWLAKDESRVPVYFDHRPFGHMLAAMNCDPVDLIGRQASHDSESETLSFED